MRYFPINVDIQDKKCVVIGGGNVAYRKVLSLIKAGAKVEIISPAAIDEIEKLVKNSLVFWIKREYEEGDLEGATLAFVAVDSAHISSEVTSEAKARGILVNVADEPSQCSFTLPSIAERGDLLVTVSTGGKCPALARQVRINIEGLIDNAHGEMLTILAEVREQLLHAKVGHDKCRDLLNKLISSDILSLLRQGETEKASKIADETLARLLQNKE